MKGTILTKAPSAGSVLGKPPTCRHPDLLLKKASVSDNLAKG